MNALDRLNQILINDKHFNPDRLNELLGAEVYRVLAEFMIIKRDDVRSIIEFDEYGNVIFKCKVCANRLKPVGLLKG